MRTSWRLLIPAALWALANAEVVRRLASPGDRGDEPWQLPFILAPWVGILLGAATVRAARRDRNTAAAVLGALVLGGSVALFIVSLLLCCAWAMM